MHFSNGDGTVRHAKDLSGQKCCEITVYLPVKLTNSIKHSTVFCSWQFIHTTNLHVSGKHLQWKLTIPNAWERGQYKVTFITSFVNKQDVLTKGGWWCTFAQYQLSSVKPWKQNNKGLPSTRYSKLVTFYCLEPTWRALWVEWLLHPFCVFLCAFSCVSF